MCESSDGEAPFNPMRNFWIRWARKNTKDNEIHEYAQLLDEFVMSELEFVKRLLVKKEVGALFWFFAWNHYAKYYVWNKKLKFGRKQARIFLDYSEQIVWVTENVLLGKTYPCDPEIKIPSIERIPNFLMSSIKHMNQSLKVCMWGKKSESGDEGGKLSEIEEEDKLFWQSVTQLGLTYYSDVIGLYDLDACVMDFLKSTNEEIGSALCVVEMAYKKVKGIYELTREYFARVKRVGLKSIYRNFPFFEAIQEVAHDPRIKQCLLCDDDNMVDVSKFKKIHVGVIMDGNRRFDKQFGLCKVTHFLGALNCVNLLQMMLGLDCVSEVTFYTLSFDNLQKRSQEELKDIFWTMNFFISKLGSVLKSQMTDLMRKIEEHGGNKNSPGNATLITLNFVGEIKKLPSKHYKTLVGLQKEVDAVRNQLMKIVQELWSKGKNVQIDNKIVNFALVYDGQREIELASSNYAQSVHQWELSKNLGVSGDEYEGDIKREKPVLKNFMWLQNDIDAVIRTGGVVRTSSFFPYQTIYSEWFFEDSMWPQFNEYDVIRILKEFYYQRKRRFGK